MSLVDRIHAEHVERQQRFAKRAVPDTGINMRNGRVVQIKHLEFVENVPITEFKPELPAFVPKLEEYGPPNPMTVAFGPVVFKRPSPRRPTLDEIFDVVCNFYSVSDTDVLSDRRTANLVKPRQIAAYLMYDMTLRSYPAMGRYLNRDHTSCLHAKRKIEWLLQTDEYLRAEIQELKLIIGGPDFPFARYAGVRK